jgi:hypothetical protein
MILSRRNGCIIINENQVFKIFEFEQEFLIEKQLLSQNIFSSQLDKKSGYRLNFVKIISFENSFYVMEKINGVSLYNLIKSSPADFYYAGLWLKSFHDQNRQNNDISRLFGDSNPHHFIINKDEKSISAIDPGRAFGKIDNIYVDLARFTVDTLKMVRIIRKKHYLTAIHSLFRGYFKNGEFSINVFMKHVHKRMLFNFKKQRSQRSFIFASISFFIVWYRFYILKRYPPDAIKK